MKRFELIILGQGSAAFAAAIKANELGVSTAMIGGNATEGALIGGTCVNVGCVPSKRLLSVGTSFCGGARNSFKGIEYRSGKLNFQKVMQEKDRLVRKLRRQKYAEVLRGLEKVTYYPVKGRFVSRNEVAAGEERLQGEKFLIATGARARIPSIEGLDGVDYLTNEQALSLRELPRSMCVVGGRALGLEFAQMYAQFGTKVTLLQRSERILPDDEPEISEALIYHLEKLGIEIFTGVTVNRVSPKGSGNRRKEVSFTAKGKSRNVLCDQLLLATGRQPNIEGLDLENAGVKTDAKGFVAVDDKMQTSAKNVWAAGDVTGEPMLETVAAKEGAIAIHNAFSSVAKKINFEEIPSAVFTYPEVARVGYTESEALDRGIKCACRVLPFDLVPKAHIIEETRGLVKMVVDGGTKRIVGVHILGPHAADLIHEGALAIKNKLTIDDIIDTVHVFPTLSESIKLAAQSFYVDIGKMSCCVE